MDKLVFQKFPVVTFASNQFINVPIILQYHKTPLIEIVSSESTSKTTKIPIFHPDGTKIAVAKGGQLYRTKEGEKAQVELTYLPGVTVCKLERQTLFEIRRQEANAICIEAELFAPHGVFVAYRDESLSDLQSLAKRVQKFAVSNTVANFRVGVWIGENGEYILGANGLLPPK